jgi:hypothetical protein
MVAEAEALPDLWAMAAAAAREELERRKLPPEPLRGLSPDALAVLGFLHGLEHGKTFLVRLEAVVPDEVDFDAGVGELFAAGLLAASWAVDQDGEAAEMVVTLRYDVDLPGT